MIEAIVPVVSKPLAVIGLVVSLVVGISLIAIVNHTSAPAPRAQAQRWADAVSRGDYVTVERMMDLYSARNIFYPMWLDTTQRHVEAGRLHPARIAVEQPRGAGVFYCIDFGDPVYVHLDIIVDDQGTIGLLHPYGGGPCVPEELEPVGDSEVEL